MCLYRPHESTTGISNAVIRWKNQALSSHLVRLECWCLLEKKIPFLDTESPLHTTSAAHFILSVNSTKPELGSEDSHCMELKAFSSLLLGNKASLFLAPLEGGFTVHPPGKFLLAGSQALWVPLRDAAITVLVFLCISSCCLSVSLCTLNMTGLCRLLCDITISLTKADPRDLVRGDFVLLPLSC